MRFSFFLFVFLYSCTAFFCQELTFEKVQYSIRSIMEKEDIPGISLAIINKKDSLHWSGGFDRKWHAYTNDPYSTACSRNTV